MLMYADLQGSLNKVKLKKENAVFSVYEGIVNSIQSNSKNILVEINTKVNPQQQIIHTSEINKSSNILIEEIIISDDGEGFTEENFKSFNTVNSTSKLHIGGKGVGRLAWLKIFEKVMIESTYKNDNKYFFRKIEFDLSDGIKEIENFEISDPQNQTVSTKIFLKHPYEKFQKYLPKTAEELGNKVLYHCLGYLIKGTFEIIIKDKESEFLCKESYRNKLEKNTKTSTFNIGDYVFEIIHIPIDANLQSKHEIILTADSREVKRRHMMSELLNSSFEINNSKKMY